MRTLTVAVLLFLAHAGCSCRPCYVPVRSEGPCPPPTGVAPPPTEKPAEALKVIRPPPGREEAKRPVLRTGSLETVPIPEGKRRYRSSQAEISVYPWPEYVTAEERNTIEEAVSNLALGGIDAQDAERYLIELDARSDDGKLKPGEEFKAVGRVVSEFKNILGEYNNEVTDRVCLARLMQVDRILRKIDGMQQRDFADREGIRSQSTDRYVMIVIKRWNWWYDLEKWRLRREPWDPREDLVDFPALDAESTEIVR